jgi:hypothetical protein
VSLLDGSADSAALRGMLRGMLRIHKLPPPHNQAMCLCKLLKGKLQRKPLRLTSKLPQEKTR